MIVETDIEVIEMMDRMGGSFVKALANAYRHADANNQAILRRAFAQYFREYTEHANRHYEQREARRTVESESEPERGNTPAAKAATKAAKRVKQ